MPNIPILGGQRFGPAPLVLPVLLVLASTPILDGGCVTPANQFEEKPGRLLLFPWTMANPTRESLALRPWHGGEAEVVMKSGERRRVGVTRVGEDGLHAGYDGVIPYADIAELKGW